MRYAVAFIVIALVAAYGAWRAWPQEPVATGYVSQTASETLPPDHVWVASAAIDDGAGGLRSVWIAAPRRSMWIAGDHVCQDGRELIWESRRARPDNPVLETTSAHGHTDPDLRMALCGPAAGDEEVVSHEYDVPPGPSHEYGPAL